MHTSVKFYMIDNLFLLIKLNIFCLHFNIKVLVVNLICLYSFYLLVIAHLVVAILAVQAKLNYLKQYN